MSCLLLGRRTSTYQYRLYQTTSNNMKMGTEPVPETSVNLHILTRLSAREHFIKFSLRQQLQNTGVLISPWPEQEGNKLMFLSEWCEFPSPPCLAGKNKTMTARVSMLLKSRASLTCFRSRFLPGRAKTLSAPRYFDDIKCMVIDIRPINKLCRVA